MSEIIEAIEEILPAFCVAAFIAVLVFVGLTAKDDDETL